MNFKTKEIFYIGACPWFNFCENLCLQFWVFLLCLSGTCNLFLIVKDFSNATHFSFLKWLKGLTMFVYRKLGSQYCLPSKQDRLSFSILISIVELNSIFSLSLLLSLFSNYEDLEVDFIFCCHSWHSYLYLQYVS